MPRVSWLLLMILGMGCSSGLGDARSAFEEGRYPAAAESYRALAGEIDDYAERELFEYALYRGLTHLALGDAQPALRWLKLAQGMQKAHPESTNAVERGQLAAAFRSMGLMPGQ
jgi:hypothetical protein